GWNEDGNRVNSDKKGKKKAAIELQHPPDILSPHVTRSITHGRAPSVIEQLRREEEEEDRMLRLLQSGEDEVVAGVGDAQGEEAEDDRVTDVGCSESEEEGLPFPTLLSYKAGPADDGSIPGDENLPRLLPDALMVHNDRWIRYKVIPPKRGAPTK
ncbi:hypothetical protein BGX21_007655, partial [Mortierella sp. AD011]